VWAECGIVSVKLAVSIVTAGLTVVKLFEIVTGINVEGSQ